jgi:cytochrome c biogenesis protein CcmG/thiol:disulfide interchange protein DsbE
MNRFVVLPIGVFVLLVVVLSVGLMLDPRQIASPFIDKPVPVFSLQDLKDPSKTLTNRDLAGKVWLVNAWASWCVSCLQEHPLLMELARTGKVSLFGLNYKDRREDALQWLDSMGDPFQRIAADRMGHVGSEWGVQSTPQSFVVDRQGLIRFQQSGPLNQDIVRKEILPIIDHLQTENPS